MPDIPPASGILPRYPSRLPSWLSVPIIIAAFLAVLATLLVIGYLLWQILVVPYQQTVVTDPMPVGPRIGSCQPQVQVEHPGWLSLDGQGVQPAKRIVLTLSCDKLLTQTVPITLEITSDPSGWIRFLNMKGEDTRPILVTTIPPGGQSRIALYPECVIQPIAPPRQIAFNVTSISTVTYTPAVTLTSAAPSSALFTIELESRAQTFLRHVVGSALAPLSAGQLALLGSLVALLWRWWDGWSKKQREFNDLYEEMCKQRNDLAALREAYSRYQSLQGIFPLSAIFRFPRIESLYQDAEAEECLRCAIEGLKSSDFKAAREKLEGLSRWDHKHWAIPVLARLVNLLDESSAAGPRAGFDPQECLEQLRIGWSKADNWPHLRCQMVRSLTRIPIAEARRFLESLDDPASDVRIEITWAFSRRERPPNLDQRLQRLITTSPHEWLSVLGEPPEVRDPFGKATAENGDIATEPFIWEHPLYGQLHTPVATIVVAPAGGGKTTAHLALQGRFWGTTGAFMLEYTDFHHLVDRPSRITARRHVAAILHRAAQAVLSLLLDDPRRLDAVQDHTIRRLIYNLLIKHLSDPHPTRQLSSILQGIAPPMDGEWHSLLSERSPAEAMRDLVAIVQALGFDELYLLVDRLNNLPEAQDLAVTEGLLRHLLNDPAFLDVPHLHVKLFLPTEWEALVVGCSGLRSGRLHLRRLQWDEISLLAMLKERLQVAGVESLNRLAVDNIYPSDLDAALAREAEGSPRRLVKLGETLLRLRASEWERAGRDPWKARLQTEDWAAMLEYGLRKAAERKAVAR